MVKAVQEDYRTKQALEKWAEPERILALFHYFWTPGFYLQKSKEGLLRYSYALRYPQ